jgi:hypothetical protein
VSRGGFRFCSVLMRQAEGRVGAVETSPDVSWAKIDANHDGIGMKHPGRGRGKVPRRG